jgi:hypothetical protein
MEDIIHTFVIIDGGGMPSDCEWDILYLLFIHTAIIKKR